jgi:uncharacterized protein (DUF1810 family)
VFRRKRKPDYTRRIKGDMPDLQRFKDAQNDGRSGIAIALAEINAGQKRGHWIWYVFPQLAGLGRSDMSQAYGIDGVREAVEYLRDEMLRARLLSIASTLAAQRTASTRLSAVMGSHLDAAKVMSSMTLFGAMASRLHAEGACADCGDIARYAEEILRWGEEEGLRRCEYTRSVLSRATTRRVSGDSSPTEDPGS